MRAGVQRSAIELGRMQQVASTVLSFFRDLPAARFEGAPSIQLDHSVRRFLGRHGLQSALEGYRGYPAHCSVSTNEIAVHGIPGERPISRGDLFSLDVAAAGGGWFTDMAWSYLMPGASRRAEDEYFRAWQAFRGLLSAIVPDMSLADLALTAEDTAARQGLAPIPEFTGHGIGRKLHETPIVPFTSAALTGASRADVIRLVPGTVISVEPVYRPLVGVEAGIIRDDNGWSYRTADGARTYHFELTVVIGRRGSTVLQWGGIASGSVPDHPPFGRIGT